MPDTRSAHPHLPAAHLHLSREVGVDPGRIAGVEELAGGLSGARIQRLTLRCETPGGAGGYRWRVVKWLAPERGWLGAASRDTAMREARLWTCGMLADLPHGIETAALAAAESSDTGERARDGALLMRDVRGRLLRHPTRTPPGHLPPAVLSILDGMARIHARFWEDARLHDPALGLTPPEAALLLAAPDTIRARIASGDMEPYLPLARAGWEAFFRLAAPADAETLRAVLRAPQPWLAAIARLPRTLLHGDVWGPNLGWLPATRIAPRRGRRLLLLDWALAAAGPATYDPLWLCGTWHTLSPPRVLAAYRVRLARHLAARGIRLAPQTWRALVDAGYLRTALTCGEALGRAATEAPAGAARQRAEERAHGWARRAASAAQRLRTSTAGSC